MLKLLQSLLRCVKALTALSFTRPVMLMIAPILFSTTKPEVGDDGTPFPTANVPHLKP